ncbi:BON domain-containing protein [Arenimonas sp.]|uniref:BON domain-containing protein n=1 Tax=Arenimonas sp. TaxID=1872635 RepID=UPI0039E3510D
MDRTSHARQDAGRSGRNPRKPTWHQASETHDVSEGDDYGLRRDAGFYFNQGQGRQRWIEQGLGQEGFERSRYSDRAENYRNGYRQAPRAGEGGEGYGGPVDPNHGQSVEGYGGQKDYAVEVFEHVAKGRSFHVSVRSDMAIVDEVRELLADNPSLDARDIDAACFQGIVTLQGTVPEHAMRHLAENLIAYCHGVRHVRNRLIVGGVYASSETNVRPSFNGENS